MSNIPLEVIYISGIVSPLFVFYFFRKLLENRNTWLILVKISVVLAVVGILLTIFQVGKYNLYLGLIVPLYSISIFRPMFKFFVSINGRTPIDTGFTSVGTGSDRIFNIVYAMLITIVPGIGIPNLGTFLQSI